MESQNCIPDAALPRTCVHANKRAPLISGRAGRLEQPAQLCSSVNDERYGMILSARNVANSSKNASCVF
jgi:hypothetical protein